LGEKTVQNLVEQVVLVLEIIIEEADLAAHRPLDHADSGGFVAPFKKQFQRGIDDLVPFAALHHCFSRHHATSDGFLWFYYNAVVEMNQYKRLNTVQGPAGPGKLSRGLPLHWENCPEFQFP